MRRYRRTSPETARSRSGLRCPPRPPNRLRNGVERQAGRTHGDCPFEHCWQLRVTGAPARMRKPRFAVGPPIRVLACPLRARVPRRALHFRIVGVGGLLLLFPHRVGAAQPCGFPTRNLRVCSRRVTGATPSRPPRPQIVLGSVHELVLRCCDPLTPIARAGSVGAKQRLVPDKGGQSSVRPWALHLTLDPITRLTCGATNPGGRRLG